MIDCLNDFLCIFFLEINDLKKMDKGKAGGKKYISQSFRSHKLH